MNSCQIKVIRGSGEGQIVPVHSGDIVSIGRSRHSNNQIVLSELDVSARHCMVRMDKDGVWLEVLSDKVTEVDGRSLQRGDRIPLHHGQKVNLGKTVSFVLEGEPGDSDAQNDAAQQAFPSDSSEPPPSQNDIDDDTPTVEMHAPNLKLPGTFDDETPTGGFHVRNLPSGYNNTPTSTLPTMQNSAPNRIEAAFNSSAQGAPPEKTKDDNTQTVNSEFETRYASFDELEIVKKKYQTRRQWKAILIGIAVSLFLGVSCCLYFWLRTDDESEMTWPDELPQSNAKSAIVFRDYIGLVFPSTLNYSESEDAVEVFTAFGKMRDIPVHIQAFAWDDTEGLQMDRKDAFSRYKEKMEEEDVSLHFEKKERTLVLNEKVRNSPGVPLSYDSFTRKLENESYFGYLAFFRYQAMNVAYWVEAPEATRSKTDEYMEYMIPSMFRVANDITVIHWEGSPVFRKNSTIKDDLDDARSALHETSPSPSKFYDIYYSLHSALIKACMANDQESLKTAQDLLYSFRQDQRTEFGNLSFRYDKSSGPAMDNTIRGEYNTYFQPTNWLRPLKKTEISEEEK